ncbi:hypothetical protein [Endozoicomonas lisbonensis]|uniref:Peptidase C39 domain-containing protein n=2 Tax=Endozoicomonas lisbonensis TaxID=3120522 RepID=A0ABV2SM21_9GAMM
MDTDLIALNTDGTPATNEPSGLYGRCVNRKNRPKQPAFTGAGHSMQATSSQRVNESPQSSDILGIIAGLSNLQISSTSQAYNSILTLLNDAFMSFFDLFSEIPDTEQDYENTLNAILLSVGYELDHVNINDPSNICRQIRGLLDTRSVIYLTSGDHHYLFVAEQNDRFFMVSHFVQNPSNHDNPNIIRRDSKQNLAKIKLNKTNSLKLYILKKPSSAGYQSM